MWHSRWDAGVLKAEALALLPCGLGMAFSQSHVMAARRHQHSRLLVEVDEYSSNPTQAFTFYNINQGRFQPPHVQMVDPVPHDAPKPPGYTRFVCVSDTHSRTDPIQMPYGDVLIHAGDFTELGLPSEVKKFNEWLGRSRPPRLCVPQDEIGCACQGPARPGCDKLHLPGAGCGPGSDRSYLPWAACARKWWVLPTGPANPGHTCPREVNGPSCQGPVQAAPSAWRSLLSAHEAVSWAFVCTCLRSLPRSDQDVTPLSCPPAPGPIPRPAHPGTACCGRDCPLVGV
nr:uncharacterized protein LOC100354497 [Oryctolagus cuniculus]